VNLVAVDNGLALFVGWHQGREAADGARLGISDDDVPQLSGLHLLEFLVRVPSSGGVLVIGATGLFDQGETGLELIFSEITGTGEVDGVYLVRFWVCPLCHPR